MRRLLSLRALLLLSLSSTMIGFSQQPTDAFQTANVSNLPVPSSVDLTNLSSRDICVNTYVFDQRDNSFASCCSSLIAPNQAYSMSTRIVSGAVGVSAPNAVIIKLAATHPRTIGNAKICNPSTPDTDNLAGGMRASSVGTPFTQTQLSTCIATTPGQPCRTELAVLGLLCGMVQATGSGFGLCQEAVPLQGNNPDDLKAAEIWQWFLYFH
jgi:hypothetical protein